MLARLLQGASSLKCSPREAAQGGLNGTGADLPGYLATWARISYDADDELLVLGGRARWHRAGHVEVQGAERGRFAPVPGETGTRQKSPMRGHHGNKLQKVGVRGGDHG